MPTLWFIISALTQILPQHVPSCWSASIVRKYYIDLPLEPTYQAAFRGMPEVWRSVLETEPNAR
jgi:hypothetical protein